MTRKIILLVVTLAAVLLIFLAWRWIAPGRGAGGNQTGPVRIVADRAKQALVLERCDSHGKLVQRLEVPRWEKNEKTGAYECDSPAGVVYGKDSQRVYMQADKGTVFAEGVSGEIRHATFRGNVRVFFDNYKPENDPSPTKRPPLPRSSLGAVMECLEENPYGVVRVYMPDMDIDNEKLLMQTAGDVTALSDRADLYGRGLEITWSQSPQELTGLKIIHGIRADLYDMGREDTMFGLPGGSPEKGPASATTQPGASESSEAAATPATRPASATTKSKGGRGKGVIISRPKMNVYELSFEGVARDVSVVSGKQSLTGAQKLTLQLEFTGGMRDGSAGRGRGATSRPGPASRPGEALAGGDSPAKSARKGAATRATTGPGRHPARRRLQRLLPEVQLSQRRGSRRAERVGRRPGPAGHRQRAGRRLRADHLPPEDRAGDPAQGRLHGPDPPTGRQQGPGRPRSNGTRGGQRAERSVGEDKITWGGSVLIEFKRMEQADQAKRAALEGKRFKEYIDKAHFKRDVQLAQGKYGDWMHCDDLVVEMGPSSKGNPQPLKSI
ncbi:MAG: hypothetical protein NT031_20770, partial [Planctomycetota bacterium]|nr:hypothetical protein [Planctomycetota bacterium]